MVDIHNLKKEDIKKEIQGMTEIDAEFKRRAIESLGDSKMIAKLVQEIIGSPKAYHKDGKNSGLLKDDYEELRWLLKVSIEAK